MPLAARVVTLALLVALAGAAASQSSTSSSLQPRERQGRFFPFYTVVRFSNIQCTGSNGLLGTCYLKTECAKNGGVASGSCAKRLGVCCVVTRNCGGTPTNSNNTYYRSPGFSTPPGTYGGGPRCSISVAKTRDAVCQIRLTFASLTLAQPDAAGNCVNDFLSVTGTDTQVPRICGVNAGQHLYLKFQNDGSPIQISINTNASVSFQRAWDIRVSQHECNEGAPNGCLMYYTGVTGQVSSFNFGTLPNAGDATRQLVSQQYAVCVRPEAGYCGIEWSQTDLTTFTLSGDTAGIGSLIGTAIVSDKGDACTSDYIIIPNAVQNLLPAGADRFCGNALLPTRSLVTPFVLTVVTDDKEAPPDDIANRGFQITYRQLVC